MKRKTFAATLILSLIMGTSTPALAADEFAAGLENELYAGEEIIFSDGDIAAIDSGMEEADAELLAATETVEIDGVVEMDGITYQYQKESDTYIVIKGSGQASVTIPLEINGKEISAVAPKAFYQDGNLEELRIPKSSGIHNRKIYIDIGESAFEGCTRLKEIGIWGVNKIGRNAFNGCENLRIISLEDDSYVSSGAFQNCPGLRSLTDTVSLCGDKDAFDIDNKIINYSECGGKALKELNIIYFCLDPDDQEGYVYARQGNLEYFNDTLASCSEEATGKISIFSQPKKDMNITKVGRRAFYGCSEITEIIIPSSVKTIETKAFYGCTGLKSIQIPESVTNIEEDAFAGANNVTIYTTAGSYAAQYAASHGIECVTNGEEKPEAPKVPNLVARGNSVAVSLPASVDGAAGYEFVIGGKSCYKDVNCLQKITTKSTNATFTFIKRGTHYAYARAYKTVDGQKIYSPWSSVNSVTVTAKTPSTPSIKKVTVSGSTVTLWLSNTSYTLGYDIVLGKGKSSVKPTNYVYSAKNQKQTSKQTKVVIKNVKKGTYYLGAHAFNRTSENKAKVFGRWSSVKKVVVK